MDGSGYAAVFAFVLLVLGFLVAMPIYGIVMSIGDGNYMALAVFCVWILSTPTIIAISVIRRKRYRKRHPILEPSDPEYWFPRS